MVSDRPNLSRDSAQPILPPSKCQNSYMVNFELILGKALGAAKGAQ